jgi:hypothetical protein
MNILEDCALWCSNPENHKFYLCHCENLEIHILCWYPDLPRLSPSGGLLEVLVTLQSVGARAVLLAFARTRE